MGDFHHIIDKIILKTMRDDRTEYGQPKFSTIADL
jgi:hypothetical protein